MKICFIQFDDYHTEILGFFFQNFINDDLFLFHPHHNSPFSCVNYYQTLFNKPLTIVDRVNEHEYHMLIFLTSREFKKLPIINRNKYLLVSHVKNEIFNGFKHLSLTPLIKTDYYYLPIYKADNTENRLNTISIIGLSHYNIEKKDVFDLYGFIKRTPNYTFNIYTRPDVKIITFFRSLPNAVFRLNTTTDEMISEIRTSKFIMTVDKEGQFYQTTGLSGSIPLGVSHDVPLIMTDKINSIYNLYGVITYNKTLHEIVDLINSLTDETYLKILNSFSDCRQVLLNYNSYMCQDLRDDFDQL